LLDCVGDLIVEMLFAGLITHRIDASGQL
jgi:hypothetical protein